MYQHSQPFLSSQQKVCYHLHPSLSSSLVDDYISGYLDLHHKDWSRKQGLSHQIIGPKSRARIFSNKSNRIYKQHLTSFSQVEIVVVQFLIPVVLPALLCFVLMTIQIYYLTRQKVAITSNQPGAGKKSTQLSKVSSKEPRTDKKKKPSPNRKAAVTILIVTTIYVLTSILSVAVWLIIYRTHLGREDKIKKLSWTELSMIYISSSTSPLLCSTVTALTLFLRSCAMQRHLKVVFGKLFKPQTSLELSMRTEESR